MNRQVVIVTLSLLLLPSVYAEQITDNSGAKLLGPVQTITTVTTITGREGERVVSRYDSQGREIETLHYISPTTLIDKSVHTYNSSGQKTETVTYNPDGSLLTKTIYLYDFQGRLSERTIFDDVGLIDRTMYAYDANGHTVDETTTSARRPAAPRSTHFYDAQEKESATCVFARDGSVRKTTYAYDDKGNVTERIVYASDGSELDRLRYEYEFDTVGNWPKQIEVICPPTMGPGAFTCTPAAVTARTIVYATQD